MKYLILFMLIRIFSVINLEAQSVTTLTHINANGGVSIDGNGNLIVTHFGPLPFVTGQEGTDIFRVTPTGEITLIAENVVSVGTGNTVDSQGFIYQASFQGNKVIKLDSVGNVVDNEFFMVPGPVGLTTIENDTLLVCSCHTNSVFKVAQDGVFEVFAGGDAFACANGITKDNEGNIYTTNFSDPRITKIEKDGTATTLGATVEGNGHIAFRSADAKLYIASYSGHQIFQMSLDGQVRLFAGTGNLGADDSTNPFEATFTRPNGIAVSQDGCSLYITQDEGVIREIKFDDFGCTTSAIVLEDDAIFEILPNPVSEQLVIRNHSGEKVAQMQIVDIQGRIVKTVSDLNSSVIRVHELHAGIYYIHIAMHDTERRFIKKIIIL